MKKVSIVIVLLSPFLSFSATVKAYFNTDLSKSYVDPYRNIEKPGDDLEAVMIDRIDKAKISVDVAIQEINLTNLAKALVRAKKRGVKVRFILEDTYNYEVYQQYTNDKLKSIDEHRSSKIIEHQKFLDANGNGYITKKELAERDAITILRKANIEIRDDRSPARSGLMHHKFIVVDEKFLLVSSANFTRSGIHGDYDKTNSIGNSNALISCRDLSEYFLVEFEYMWEGKFKIEKPFRDPADFLVKSREGDTFVRTHFSPTNIKRYGFKSSGNGLIVDVLKRAKKSIFASLFVFTDQRISDSLLELRQKRPKLVMEFLVDFNFANRFYSELLDMWGLQMRNPETCFYQDGNKPWRVPEKRLGIPWLNPGDKLHHKFAVIDEKYIIFGSHNWSISANDRNDETLLVIENPSIAKKFLAEQSRLSSVADFGPSEFLLNKIDRIDEECGE